MPDRGIRAVPPLRRTRALHGGSRAAHDAALPFWYELPGHEDLPHVVKFSGGRTSGMMLFVLCEAGLLHAERGDVVVFNNTSAEHPATYEFVRQCKAAVESRYGLPFFLVEFQTHEDARRGEWVRLPSYRLVQPVPRSETQPDGYCWRGEVFEELLSWTGYVPNQFKRTCTSRLKLETTRAFLTDWFACTSHTARLGHFGKRSRLDDDEMYEHHLRYQGSVPRHIFLEKKRCVRSRPVFRPAQRFADYSTGPCSITNPSRAGKSLGQQARLGPEGMEYLAFVGLRHDEMRRVARVRQRNEGGPHAAGSEGEYVYLPLSDMGVTAEEVTAFWKNQTWDLEMERTQNALSNCTYCFLKGVRVLQRTRRLLSDNGDTRLKQTPCDLDWWVRMEQHYGRDLEAEQRTIRGTVPDNFIGFFGASGFSYTRLGELPDTDTAIAPYEDSVLPCDCTD